MKDKDFLKWLHERLHHKYGEDLNLDYMIKIQAIIDNTPDDQITNDGKVLNFPWGWLKKIN